MKRPAFASWFRAFAHDLLDVAAVALDLETVEAGELDRLAAERAERLRDLEALCEERDAASAEAERMRFRLSRAAASVAFHCSDPRCLEMVDRWRAVANAPVAESPVEAAKRTWKERAVREAAFAARLERAAALDADELPGAETEGA